MHAGEYHLFAVQVYSMYICKSDLFKSNAHLKTLAR